MNGFSEEDTCPNCGKKADTYTDWKPFSYVSMQCNHCGLLITPTISYMTLEELNEARQDANENKFGRRFKMLKKLPKQTFKY